MALSPEGRRDGELPRLGTLMELADKMEIERSYFVEESGDWFNRVEARLERIEELLRAS